MMLKNLFFNALFFTFLSAVYCSRLVAISDYGSPVIGASVNFGFSDNIINSRGYVWDTDRQAATSEIPMEAEKSYGARILVGWELVPNITVGFELGSLSQIYITNHTNSVSSAEPMVRIEADMRQFVARIDANVNIIGKDIDFLFGVYGGVVSSEMNDFLNKKGDGGVVLEKRITDYRDAVFGMRSGFSYNLDDFMAITINYLCTTMPNHRYKKAKALTSDNTVRLEDIDIFSHSVEMGFKWFFDSFNY